jgi:hypothetical protein
MKVLCRSLAAPIGLLLLLLQLLLTTTLAVAPAVLPPNDSAESAQLRLRGGTGAVTLGAAEEEDGGEVEERSLADCGTAYSGYPELHFCNSSVFFGSSSRCDTSLGIYGPLFSAPRTGGPVCATAEPTVLVLGNVRGDAAAEGAIGSVTFDLAKNGARIRRFVEREWPYTVFGNTFNPHTVQSRVLMPANYTLNVIVKDRAGCVVLVQDYQFTIATC